MSYPKANYNLSLIIVLLYGHLLNLYIGPLSDLFGIQIPFLTVSIVYYSLFSLVYRRWGFLSFIILSSLIIVNFLAFVFYKQISLQSVQLALNQRILATVMFSYVLLPFVFLSWTLDVYSLPFEIVSLTQKRIFYFIIPVLSKRELIKHRFRAIQDSLYSRGVQTRSFWGKYLTLFKWSVPLFVTTLFEGVEASDLNKMLATNIRAYHPSRRIYYRNRTQKALLTIFFIALVLRGWLWIDI